LGIFDEIDKAMKKVEDEVKKAELDKQFRNLGDGIARAGSDLSRDTDRGTVPAPEQKAPSAASSERPARTPHPGYSRITAWMKTRYKGKISGITSSSAKKLELEQISAEACSGLSSKAKKGFLDYLRSQNYEQLLK
jgi:hypothetical protein